MSETQAKQAAPTPGQRLKASFETARGAIRAATKNKPAPCEECAHVPELQAVILFPALGTPYVAPASEKTIKVYMVVEDACATLFDITGSGKGKEAPLAWYFINKHMRLRPFKQAHKITADLKGDRLYTSEGAAQAGIKVWYHGHYAYGALAKGSSAWARVLYDHDGNVVATLRQSAVDFFILANASHGSIIPAHELDPKEADVTNKPLPHLFEIELSLQGLRVQPSPNKAYNLAWMVTCVYQRAKKGNGQAALKGVTHWEHQDKLIYDFLAMMQKHKQHFTEPFTFDVPGIKHSALSDQLKDEPNRLKAYHPVMFKTKPVLHLGHLTDVHISSRHFALAQSKAQAIPGVSEPLGPKITNCFTALQELCDTMRAKGADALFVTGDLVDFNQNFNPKKLKAGVPRDEWAQYDLSIQFNNAKANDPELYPRGLDDMLAYSLFKYSYQQDCPVFLTTGNHEAYDVPYGIAPRLNDYGIGRTLRQTLDEYKRRNRALQLQAYARRLEGEGKHAEAAKVREEARLLLADLPVIPELATDAAVTAEEAAAKAPAHPDWIGLPVPLVGQARFARDVLHIKAAEIWKEAKDPTNKGDTPLEYAFSKLRANEGIPADHNLTIYEACMAYGPSYGQLIKSWNFITANFDWFFMLFTPLADFQLRYGKAQCLIGLDWGETEIMMNLDMTPQEVLSAAHQADLEVNGDGSTIPPWVHSPAASAANVAIATAKASVGQVMGLPRADKSISDIQQSLIRSALKASGGGCKNLLFSHFTIINYGSGIEFAKERRQFVLRDATYNEFNRGTFAENRRWLFSLLNDGSGEGRLHYTLAGHSHRAAAYSVSHLGTERRLVAVRAYEPMEPGDATYDDVHARIFGGSQTRVLVTSSGGPIGGQNYDGELLGWNRTAPSGTLLKTDAQGPDEFRRIIAQQRSAQPRFCVALDFLMVEKGQPVIVWAKQRARGTLPAPKDKYWMFTAHVMHAVPFIEKVEFFVWQSGAQRGLTGRGGSFKSFSTTLKRNPGADKVDPKNRFDEPRFAYEMTLDDVDGLVSLVGKSPKAPILARITFNKALKQGVYAHFNFDDPWCFPVSMTPGPDQSMNIERPSGEFGEVPNFRELGNLLPDYYYRALNRANR